jgi:UDP-N-acetylglucosamine diphosphorylase/glucosamine-1-phosphate N-acetyltransferase
MGALLYGETTVGPMCKVGGEVGETIFQGYANKQHDGFLGHSYVGEWVNLGAGTNTSDLKNNYSTVRVPIGGKLVDSGGVFAGLYIGDHAKSGIGTTFNTGTVVGVCSNVYGAGYPPKYIPSFAWGGGSKFAEHELAAALETARRAMERRGKAFGARESTILKDVFELTRTERASFLGL